jgi:hypothetical protein
VALATFLSDRADDENARKEISQAAFINAAKSLGVNITQDNLAEFIARPPLTNILEPLEPGSGVIRYKGNTENTGSMSVRQAQDIVNQNAKSAMKRGMGK